MREIRREQGARVRDQEILYHAACGGKCVNPQSALALTMPVFLNRVFREISSSWKAVNLRGEEAAFAPDDVAAKVV
jgi:hypothetical protein